MKYVLSLFMAVTLLACNAQQGESTATGNYTDVSNAQAQEMMAAHPDLQIIDVRTDGEVSAGMIEGAKQMDISKPNFKEQLATLDKSKPVLVYCASGRRSKSAQNIMKDEGFNEVHNLTRGYSGWR